MKLNFLNEEISQKEFFNFYALAAAIKGGYIDENEKEIEHLLEFYADTLWDDQFNQFIDIVLNRFSSDDDVIEDPKTGEIINKLPLNDMSFQEKQKLLKKRIESFDFESSWFTGKTWANLANYILSISRPQTTKGKVLQLDKLYGTMHHGGLIADYFDEKEWLEQALNFRANSNMNQLLRKVSDDVKDLLKSAQYGIDTGSQVTYWDKLLTTINRTYSNKIVNPVVKNKGIKFDFILDYQLVSDKYMYPRGDKKETVPISMWSEGDVLKVETNSGSGQINKFTYPMFGDKKSIKHSLHDLASHVQTIAMQSTAKKYGFDVTGMSGSSFK